MLAQQPQGFSGRSTLYTWLYGVLLNLERRERRRQGMRRRKLRVLWDGQPDGPCMAPAAEASLEVAEWKEGLWGQVAKLPDVAAASVGVAIRRAVELRGNGPEWLARSAR